MEKGIMKNILKKLSSEKMLQDLDENLSLSELNSFLLELFRRKAKKIKPARVFGQFRNNRFVHPSGVDTLEILKTELEYLTYAASKGFKPLRLSLLAPLGTCSVMGFVDQNNILSTVRGVEVVSDATNVLALKIAEDTHQGKDKIKIYRYSTVHRHVRGQVPPHPDYSAHFSLFCMASGGYDRGNFDFELSEMNKHVELIYSILSNRFGEDKLRIRFYLKKNSSSISKIIKGSEDFIWSDKKVEMIEDKKNDYYQLVQFKIFLISNNNEYNLADGGLVNWTQKLLANKKLRLVISGIGIELIHKIDPRPS